MPSRPLWAIPCTQGPRAANDSGPRTAKSLRLIVLHSAEAADSFGGDTSAEGVANYFAKSTTKASTQLAVDRDSCVRMLPDLVVPWGARGANHDGLHVEICGYAKWTKSEWLERPGMLRRASAKCAMWAWRYGIPVRMLTVAQVRAGRMKGFTTHVDVNMAFKRGTHWDPGPNFPREWFMERTKEFYEQIKEART